MLIMPVPSWALITASVVGSQQEHRSGEQQAEACSHAISWGVCGLIWFVFLLMGNLH